MWQETASISAKTISELKGVKHYNVFMGSVENMVAFKRPQTPEDIGNAVVFLVSDEAKEITGQALNVDGGAIFN